MNVHFSSKTDDWATPEGFAEKYGPFDLDPCADESNAKAPVFYTKEDDGLGRTWEGRVWMNPPYGRDIKKWIAKAVASADAGATVVCLIPARTDTSWWHDFVLPRGKIEFLRGRLKFGGSKNAAPFPSAVVIFEPISFGDLA